MIISKKKYIIVPMKRIRIEDEYNCEKVYLKRYDYIDIHEGRRRKYLAT